MPKTSDIAEFKAMSKVAPDLLRYLLTNGLRSFVRVESEGGSELNWFGVVSNNVNTWANPLLADSLASAKGRYADALVNTPTLLLQKCVGRSFLTTTAAEDIAVNAKAFKGDISEMDLGLKTSIPAISVYSIAADAVSISVVSAPDNTPVAKLTPSATGNAYLAGMCGMFGFEYVPEHPVLVEYYSHIGSGLDVTSLKNEAVNWPKKILNVAVPGIQWLHISVPDAPVYGNPEMSNRAEWAAYWAQASTAGVLALRAPFGAPEGANGSPQGIGVGAGFHFAIPIRSSGREWCKSWRHDARNTGNVMDLMHISYMGYSDTRFLTPGVSAAYYHPVKNALDSYAICPESYRNLDGSAMTQAEVGLQFQSAATNSRIIVAPIFGPLGKFNVTLEGDILIGAESGFRLDEFPDIPLTMKTIKIACKRSAALVTRTWYEYYYTTGLGIYTPRTSTIQQATLKTWTDDSVQAMGVVGYSSPMPIAGTIIDQLQIRQEYKRRKEAACEVDDFYTLKMYGNVTWATVKSNLDAAVSRNRFYSPVIDLPFDMGSDLVTGAESITYTKTDVDSISRVTATSTQIYNLIDGTAEVAADLSSGAAPTYVGWTPTFTSEQQTAIASALAVSSEVRTYSKPDPRQIGLNMLNVFQFPKESLSNSDSFGN